MLVLSRKLSEKITIGDSIVLTIVQINNGAVRIGIEAPREVSVLRNELLPGDFRSLPSDWQRGRGREESAPQGPTGPTHRATPGPAGHLEN